MKHIRPALGLTFFFIILMGLGFPGLTYLIGHALFPYQAEGSLVKNSKGEIVGSALIAQGFTKAQYFHPRPSAAGSGYDATNSAGTNLGPTSKKLFEGIHDPKDPSNDFDGVVDLAKAYRKENNLSDDAQVPVDAVTRSGSGLDPDISLANAELQAPRIAKARNITLKQVQDVIDSQTEGAFLGVFGSSRINVLETNLKLDSINSTR